MLTPPANDSDTAAIIAAAEDDVRAFVRHEVADGKLRIGIKLKGAGKAKQEAFVDIADWIRTATDVAMVYGGTD